MISRILGGVCQAAKMPCAAATVLGPSLSPFVPRKQRGFRGAKGDSLRKTSGRLAADRKWLRVAKLRRVGKILQFPEAAC
jgi:hypothetical protein